MLYSGYRLTKEVPNLQIEACERYQNKDVLSLYKGWYLCGGCTDKLIKMKEKRGI
ncbi:hypothetical protein U9I19_000215 [Bacillus phage KKP_4049]